MNSKLLHDFLNEIIQRVVLNGQSSTWRSVNTEAPQGSVLDPLLFFGLH